MNKIKISFYILLSFSVFFFLSSMSLFIALTVLGHVYKSPQPTLAYTLIALIFVSIILSVLLHFICIPLALHYYKDRYINHNDRNLTLFHIFFLIIAIIVVPRWEREVKDKTTLELLRSQNEQNEQNQN